MKTNQLTRGFNPGVMCVENKDGDIDGAAARIKIEIDADAEDECRRIRRGHAEAVAGRE